MCDYFQSKNVFIENEQGEQCQYSDFLSGKSFRNEKRFVETQTESVDAKLKKMYALRLNITQNKEKVYLERIEEPTREIVEAFEKSDEYHLKQNGKDYFRIEGEFYGLRDD